MADGNEIITAEQQHDNMVEILSAWQDAVRPKSRMSVSEWAAAHRSLPSSSVSSGRWENEKTPYLVDIMNSLSERDPARVVVVMAGAQVGKSEAGYNCIGYWIDEAPANIILALPTEKSYSMVSGTRITPLIQLTDILQEKFAKQGTVELKKFVGGALHMVSAKSAPSLRAMNARYVVADECDAYPHGLAGEGDPLTLLRKRMNTFEWQSKMLITSTPLLEESSRIAAYMALTDWKKFLIPCLGCGHYQPIVWEQIKWDEDKPATARFECAECGHAHVDSDKTAMLAAGRWEATQEAANANWVGYHLSALYSPYGWYSWVMAVEEFIASKTDENKRQSWTNTILGLPYKHAGYRPTIALDRVKPERYDASCPSETLVLTAGIDTQQNHIEMYVWGWEEGERTILIDHVVLNGDLTKQSFWAEVFDSMAQTVYSTADGRTLPIQATCIDSGGSHTSEVYNFAYRVHATGYRRFYVIKGQDGFGRDIISKSPKLVAPKREPARQVELYRVGVDTAKSQLYKKIQDGHLRTPITLPNGELVTKEFYKQLTAETVQTVYKNGFAKNVWVKDYIRNEALDCWVYAYAALKAINPQWDKIIKNKGKSRK